ncbi:methane monooxygenase PmoA-like [Algoriphagus zhangzhouensis]|uniref:Methane oxygenase PmoA n=2 Tax=Algoriphagus zhangzhouensis TaxID=1073327 RepID=A0A1M7ZKA3_9BACT|nr:methane monooxygenase PmoA-like [Algoriphagus zhangzhouensis]SHO65345.1 Methane oxygenase PmoA [Algoriphagus zhangzhouensis]
MGFFLVGGITGFAQENIEIKVNEAEKKVDVIVDNQLFTSYIYPSTIKKPVLWPVISPEGNVLTRSYPMENKAGDRTDHPHHVGIWFNYGDVNGLDFWNNSDAIPAEERSKFGTIYHQSLGKVKDGKGKASFETESLWKAPDNTSLLSEKTTFSFQAKDGLRIIDRKTTLTALVDEVDFTDNKEGMYAIRVARELELPSDKPTELMDSHGVVTKVAKMDNTYVKGDYRSSEGIEGGDVWGTRATWMKLGSEINGEDVSLVIVDHPKNVGYPTYWHARDYGLFAANPLGQKVFSEGKEELNYSLKKGQSVTFNYRMIIASSDLTDEEINQLVKDFK